MHNHSTIRHPRQDETIRKIKELYQWPKMNQWIMDYVKVLWLWTAYNSATV